MILIKDSGIATLILILGGTEQPAVNLISWRKRSRNMPLRHMFEPECNADCVAHGESQRRRSS